MAFVSCEQFKRSQDEQNKKMISADQELLDKSSGEGGGKITLEKLKQSIPHTVAEKSSDGVVLIRNYDGSEVSIDAVRKGAKGDTGASGANGIDGKSAYEIWKANGGTGSERDFLNSLKGEKGDKGEAGTRGPKGDKGDGADIASSVDNVTVKFTNGKLSAVTKVDNVTIYKNENDELVATSLRTVYDVIKDFDKLEFATKEETETARGEARPVLLKEAGIIQVIDNGSIMPPGRVVKGLPPDFMPDPTKRYTYDFVVYNQKYGQGARAVSLDLVISEVSPTGNPYYRKTVGVWRRTNETIQHTTNPANFTWSTWEKLDNDTPILPSTNETIAGKGLQKVGNTIAFADFPKRNFRENDYVLALGADNQWHLVKLPPSVKEDRPVWAAITTDVLLINGVDALSGSTISRVGQKTVRFRITNNFETPATNVYFVVNTDQPAGARATVENAVYNISNGTKINPVIGGEAGGFSIPSLPVGNTEFEVKIDINTPVGSRHRFGLGVRSYGNGRIPTQYENHKLNTTNSGVTKEVVATGATVTPVAPVGVGGLSEAAELVYRP